MARDNATANRTDEGHDEHRGILGRIEEKLDRLLHGGSSEWHTREWAAEDSPFAYYEPGDPSPRFFGEARADAPGWDPSIAGPRFDRIDVGSVGSHGVDPVSTYYGAQRPLVSAHNSAREYYLLMRARAAQRNAGSPDPGYTDFRRSQAEALDRDYREYCREKQDEFDRDFDAWRERRGRPPSAVDEPSRKESADANAR
jgi:hypothetical protein